MGVVEKSKGHWYTHNTQEDLLNNTFWRRNRMIETVNMTEVLKQAIETYGKENQSMMVLEEMAELQKEVCKSLRGNNNHDEIVEEIADVLIMLEQLKIMHDVQYKELSDMFNFKINRLKERLEQND